MPKLFPHAERPPAPRPEAKGEVKGLKCAEPGCDGELVLKWTPKWRRFWYSCSRWPRCDGSLPADVDGSPRGEPRTKELQGWRVRAHEAFDTIWKKRGFRRHTAYAWLRRVMVLPPDKAHISRMDVEQCRRVIELVEEKGPDTPFWESWYRPGKRVKPKRKR